MMTDGPRYSRAEMIALAGAAMAALLWLFAARVLGPNELWDQTQPKTVSYTTDIVAHGNWILPIERGEFPATKPPLYTWIAAPFVALLGYNSAIAHKFPSVLAMCACWVVMVRLGRSIGRRSFSAGDRRATLLAWSIGLMLPANYALFKLGYLARPDMLLTLWITLGWMACTAVFIDAHEQRRRAWPVVVYWSCVALAALTKGPPAVLLLVYAVFGARVVAGRWGAVHRLQWWWGLPVAVAVPAAWLFAAWRVNPEHVYEQLWYAEVWGRITGSGPEGSRSGPIDVLRTVHEMPLYFLARLAPWSVLSIIAVVVLLMRDQATQQRRWRNVPQPLGCWLVGAMLFVLITVAVFSLSAGKRADYLVPCYPAAVLLASWMLTQVQVNVTRRAVPVAIGAAAVTMTAMTVHNQRQPAVDHPGFSDAIETFIDDAHRAIAERPAPVVFFRAGNSHIQAMLGSSSVDSHANLKAALEAGQPFWVVSGRWKPELPYFKPWFERRHGHLGDVTVVERCDTMPDVPHWMIDMALYWVEPGESRKSKGGEES